MAGIRSLNQRVFGVTEEKCVHLPSSVLHHFGSVSKHWTHPQKLPLKGDLLPVCRKQGC